MAKKPAAVAAPVAAPSNRAPSASSLKRSMFKTDQNYVDALLKVPEGKGKKKAERYVVWCDKRDKRKADKRNVQFIKNKPKNDKAKIVAAERAKIEADAAADRQAKFLADRVIEEAFLKAVEKLDAERGTHTSLQQAMSGLRKGWSAEKTVGFPMTEVEKTVATLVNGMPALIQKELKAARAPAKSGRIDGKKPNVSNAPQTRKPDPKVERFTKGIVTGGAKVPAKV